MLTGLSIRARTTLLASLLVAIALVAGSALLLVALHRSLTNNGDDLARSRARDLASLVRGGTVPSNLSNITGESVAQVVTGSGQVLAASPNVRGRPPISSFRPSGSAPVVRTLTGAPDDNETESYRLWALAASSADGPVTIYVGDSLESVGEATRTLRRSLLVGVPALLALLATSIWLVIGRALRPVEDIRSEVANISDRGLDRRVPVPRADDEIGRLAVTMNQMLARLESSSRRQQEFVGDASHELQSPIAGFRSQLEVALAQDKDADAWRAVARELLEGSDQMERLVRDLLFLAREESAAPIRHELLDLDDIVLQEAARVRSTASVTIDTSEVSGAPVRGSIDELRRLVRNLLENAAKHGRTAVRLSVSLHGGRVQLDVVDDGPGIAAGERTRVFDRFYRLDDSRSRDSGGTGLGLAIARAIAERHGGRLELMDATRGAHIVLILPAAPGPAEA